jgi:hypothetical protein
MRNGKEPYLKLGRLSVIEEFRGNRLANVLIQAGLKWAGERLNFFERILGGAGSEGAGVEVPCVCSRSGEGCEYVAKKLISA